MRKKLYSYYSLISGLCLFVIFLIYCLGLISLSKSTFAILIISAFIYIIVDYDKGSILSYGKILILILVLMWIASLIYFLNNSGLNFYYFEPLLILSLGLLTFNLFIIIKMKK